VNTDTDSDLWIFRQSNNTGVKERFLLFVLVIAGFICAARLADWWFRAEHIASLPLFVLLSFIFWYGILRLLLIWINHLSIRKPTPRPAPKNLRVAIFTTSSPGEPLSMFEKTLEACSKISYPHTTYLLDDTKNPLFKVCAEKHGAIHLELVGIPGAKAGKINAALAMTNEDIILVLDPDHIPFSNFFDEVLGFFDDETVGYVQVAQAYYNQYRSFTAKAAAEQTYSFYGPTQMGLHGRNCAVAIGSNCTFRRKALLSINGHGIGLAEDLITAIRIHAAGWKSIYHPVIVSRGLVPEDFGSFCKQQLKWARGVHEVLFAEVPRLFKKLNFWQRISYTAIGSYYFVGVTTLMFLLIPFMYLLFGILPAKMHFIEFIQFGAPLLIISILIYFYVQYWLCHPATERGFHWRGMVLKFACWPVFFLGFILSIINADIPYIPTAKQAVIGKITPFAYPLIIQTLLFPLIITYILYERRYVISETVLVMTAEKTWGMIAFATVSFIIGLGGIYAIIDSQLLKQKDPWEDIDISYVARINSKE
jgi:cellulose synthase (UDP-forming)